VFSRGIIRSRIDNTDIKPDGARRSKIDKYNKSESYDISKRSLSYVQPEDGRNHINVLNQLIGCSP